MYSNNYDDILLMGDFNVKVSETSFSSFCKLWSKKHYQPVDLLQKAYNSIVHRLNSPNSFQKTALVETDLSHFHRVIFTMIKLYSPKLTPKIVAYRKYANFDKDKFIEEISFNLQKHNFQELSLEAFISMFKIISEKHAVLKINM